MQDANKTELICRDCGSKDIHSDGSVVRRGGKVQSVRCYSCGHKWVPGSIPRVRVKIGDRVISFAGNIEVLNPYAIVLRCKMCGQIFSPCEPAYKFTCPKGCKAVDEPVPAEPESVLQELHG